MANEVFATTAARMAFLTDPARYAGQLVADLETEQAYMLNAAGDAWIPLNEACTCGMYVGNL